MMSVVIPCLNRARYLVPTIQSVLDQDYGRIECIIIDGGSTDGTIDILKSYGDKIKWASEPDRGHADAINKGWQRSQGKILAWLNADDVWVVPSAASQAVAYLEAHPDVDVVYGDCGATDDDGNLVGMSYLHEWDLEYAVEHCDHCIPQPAAFIRRRALDKVGGLDAAFYQKKDHELWLRIGLVGKIAHTPVLLAHARSTKGLSYDGRTAAPACIQVTKRFYSLPNIPPALQRKRARAFSNSYLRGMGYAFAGGHLWGLVFGYALRATLADPTNAVSALRHLRGYVLAGAREDLRLRRPVTLLSLPLKALRSVRGWMVERPRTPNLLGDRDIEWSWVAAQMPHGPGEALDFGSGSGHLALLAAQRGFDVTAIDLETVEPPYVHPRLRFLRGDILKLPLAPGRFDLVINCSTVEHVGLVGRYGMSEEQPDGDLDAMARLKRLLKVGGTMLLTIPVGRDALFAPLCRVYGDQRLPRLLEGYAVEREAYWVKDTENRWVLSDRPTALNFKCSAGSWNALRNVYALGCFVLRRT